jgi:NADPH:quinone reductase-like Zn-dependent oxidoreductase/acyl carrier protein
VTAQLLGTVKREQAESGCVWRVCLVTRGAMAVYDRESVNPEQTALLGLVRSFRAEYPAVAVQVVDLPLASAAGELGFAALVDGWLERDATESCEVALRGGKFFRPGLETLASEPKPGSEQVLVARTPGLLESLREEPWTAPDPAADEIQIACLAHGLNFRDVLTAMGSYAGVSAPLGAECAGVVLKAGSGSGFAPGTAVVAFAPSSLRSVVNVPASSVIAKPVRMSFAEAATIPVAFLTAHYAFSRLAGLAAGQTVLVHSAAGGLGMAAVQLARRAGATVIATAGNETKRALLRRMGIEHVFDSRTEEFAEDVLRVPSGRGVDVVLNSLSGEKITAGFGALARGGAFLEVGKRDIWSAGRVAAARPDARYWAFDLGKVAQREPGLIQEMMREVFEGFGRGELAPLPLEMYPMREVESAFRQMASGRHVGKLVLMRRPRPMAREEWARALRGGTVLITGGTGALGLATARWLLSQGAKRLVLASRRGASEAASELVAEFAGRVVVERVDVADREQLGAVLTRVRGVGDAPLRVVIHAAGEVDDRLLADLDMDRFAGGMRTKVSGAQLLAEMTEDDPLVATVYFSSVTALLGSAGQAGYAGANAYLDGLAEERTARGLRTLSVNWGAWAGDGMAGRLSDAAMARAMRQGMRPMLPATALEALGEAILSGRARATIADVDWAAYRAQFPAGTATRGFFEGFLPVGQETTTAALAGRATQGKAIQGQSIQSKANRDAEEVAAILGAGRVERAPRMEAFVRAAARKVLGLSAGRPIPGEMPLQELGLDSLMALELRNVLAQALGRPLSATLLFDYPTTRGLAQYLLSLLLPEGASTTGVSKDDAFRVQAEAESAGLEAELAAMSDDEAEELLLAELDRKGLA